MKSKGKTEKCSCPQVKKLEAENAKGNPHRLALTEASKSSKK